MTVIQLYGVLHRYGVDVLLLALGVTLLTSLLKKTVMKSVSKKVFVFLPFGLGILIYGLYSLLARGGACFTADALRAILGNGIGTGCAATLYYIFYEQFLRGKFPADPIAPLLECVPEDKRQEASKAISDALKGVCAEDACEKIEETLACFADPPLSEEELSLTAELLKEYIYAIT